MTAKIPVGRDGMIADGRLGFVARDVGQHGRIGNACDGRPPHACIGIVLGEGGATREVTVP